MIKRIFFFILLFSVAFTSCKQKSKLEKKDKSLNEMQNEDGGNYVPMIEGAFSPIYKSIDTTNLHVNIFYPTGVKPSSPLPIIVYFFGGAFIHGSPTQYETHCKYFASRGMIAATADYRVISRNNTTALECVYDAKSCIRWIRKNADSLGVDPDKIIMGGGSAGGLLCLTNAINNSAFEESSDPTSISCVPNALVLINPVVNTEEFEFRIKKFSGKAAEINPLTHIQKNLPPTILFHGTKDEMSGFKFIEKFVNENKQIGNDIELHPYEGMEHGFAQMNKNDGKYYQETLKLTDEWLIKHGYLSGTPTVD